MKGQEKMKPLIKLRIAEKEAKYGVKIYHSDLADKLEVTKQQFSSWVNGRSYPRANKLFELAKELDCRVDDLYDYNEN